MSLTVYNSVMVQNSDRKGSDIKVVLLSATTISLSAAFLWHLSNIARFGTHVIHEPSKLILCLELIGMSVILITGVACFLLQLRPRHKERE